MQSKLITEHRARFGADPEGLTRAKAIVANFGFRIRSVINSQKRHHVFLATDAKGRRRILKATDQPEDIVNLENEVRAHAFIRRVFARSKVPFAVPEGRFHRYQDGALSEFEYVPGKQVVHPNRLAESFTRPFTERDLEAVFQGMLALHRVTWSEVPAFFRRRARAEFTHAKMAKKLREKYLAPSIGVTVSKKDAAALAKFYDATACGHRFAHHDIVPWNFLRRPDGGLALVDGEFARWEMKWYDVAYYALQTRVLIGDEKHSRTALRYFLKRFREELPRERVEEEIFNALAYWTGACLFMAAANKRLRIRATELVRPVLARDLSAFI